MFSQFIKCWHLVTLSSIKPTCLCLRLTVFSMMWFFFLYGNMYQCYKVQIFQGWNHKHWMEPLKLNVQYSMYPFTKNGEKRQKHQSSLERKKLSNNLSISLNRKVLHHIWGFERYLILRENLRLNIFSTI